MARTKHPTTAPIITPARNPVDSLLCIEGDKIEEVGADIEVVVVDGWFEIVEKLVVGTGWALRRNGINTALESLSQLMQHLLLLAPQHQRVVSFVAAQGVIWMMSYTNSISSDPHNHFNSFLKPYMGRRRTNAFQASRPVCCQ